MTQKPIRIMWLLNHTTLRKFEVKQLNALGINEIFCPKSFPYDEGNLSATVDYSFDTSLSIPQQKLEILNQQNWYESPSHEAWDIANKYFDIAIIGFFPRQIESAVKNFQGSVVLRVFGLARGYSYTKILDEELGSNVIKKLRELGNRFWFGAGYEHLKNEEGSLLKKRDCFLPVGLEGKMELEKWSGNDARILFVCPRIGTSTYFNAIYKKFVYDFSGLNYQIGGAQPIDVNDSNVLGFVTYEQHQRNMREMRVMFYHSREPNHIHYHPFEAIRAGMPLVFMSGGLLDGFGGVNLPGRCETIKEARSKIERILNDDWKLIESIRTSQICLLDSMKPENCEHPWREGFKRILLGLEQAKSNQLQIDNKKVKIGVIVPVAYRGGSLRGAKMLAHAIELGSREAGDNAEVIFGHLNEPELYSEEEFSDLTSTIKRRPFEWRLLKQDEANRAMAYAGLEREMHSSVYQIPDDGIHQFMDCDLWVIVSDRIDHPILPVRPYVLMVYDYLQRYESFLPDTANHKFVRAAHAAQKVLVTTRFTQQDAIQFAGLPSRKVVKLPMLAPQFKAIECLNQPLNHKKDTPYFLWTTNLSLHKNHKNAFKALKIYYEQFNGNMECRVTGVGTKKLLSSELPHLEGLKESVNLSPQFKRHMKILGELPDSTYQRQLSDSAFLWHAGRNDNGTFSVIEAAHLGVPALSSDYPAMREIDDQFALNLQWMNADSPRDMANQLKIIEVLATSLKGKLPNSKILASQSLDQLALAYWAAVKECL